LFSSLPSVPVFIEPMRRGSCPFGVARTRSNPKKHRWRLPAHPLA
jgi:hypothetical protein